MDSERRKGGNPIWAFLIGLIFATVLLGYYLTRFVTWWQSCLVVNALYGLLLFELGWRDTLRFRQVDEERDKLFPAYRRLDVKNWRNRKWMFYPGAMTLMPIRALVSLGSFAVCCVVLHIVMLGHDMNKPTTGLRDFLRVKMFQWWNQLIPLAAFMSVKYQTIDYDYSYYLGADYLKTQQLPKKAPTVVSNHQSWIDNMILKCSPLAVAFAAKIETKKVWILGSMIKFTQGIFITRGGTKEERELQIKQIIDRQEAVEKNPDWNPICIYPEGTQSNGSALLPFKKGAFASMKAVTPTVVKYDWGTFSCTWDSMTFLGQAPLMYSYPTTYGCTVSILPPFKPNKYLLETFKDKGKEDWEIFAWAVRDIMARVGQFTKNEQHLDDKFIYKQFMAGHFDQFDYQGKTFKAEPFKHKQPRVYDPTTRGKPAREKVD